MNKILKTALFSAAIIAPTTIVATTVSCGTKNPTHNYKTAKELQTIFNNKNLTTPVKNAISKKFANKNLPAPTLLGWGGEVSFKHDTIQNIQSYNPNVTIHGTFKYKTINQTSYITNFFNLTVSYDEKTNAYSTSNIEISTTMSDANGPTTPSPMAYSNWENPVMNKLNQYQYRTQKVSNVKLTKTIATTTVKNKAGDIITTDEFKGTLTYLGKSHIVSAEVVYNATTGKGEVTKALMPFIADANRSTSLRGQVFAAIESQPGIVLSAMDNDSLVTTVTNKDSLTTTKISVSGIFYEGNGGLETAFVVNLSYNFKTLEYTLNPKTGIIITPNNRMLLKHDKIEATIKAKLNLKNDTLVNFGVASFTQNTKTADAYVKVIGQLTTSEQTTKVFNMQVSLINKKPVAGDYTSTNIDANFKDTLTTGDLYKAILPTVATTGKGDKKVEKITNFKSFSIANVGTATLDSKYSKNANYQAVAKVSLDVTLQDGSVVSYTETATYEFNWTKFSISGLILTDKMNLSHDKIEAVIKAKLSIKNDVLVDFHIEAFAAKDTNADAYVKVMGQLTTSNGTIKIFHIQVALTNHKPVAGTYTSFNAKAYFSDISSTGKLAIAVSTSSSVKSTIKNFTNFNITKLGTINVTFDYSKHYTAETQVSFSVTQNGKVVNYTILVSFDLTTNKLTSWHLIKISK